MALSKSSVTKSSEKIINQRMPVAERIELKQFCRKLPKLLTRPRFFIFFVRNPETKKVVQNYLQNKIPEYLSEHSIKINSQNIDFFLYLKNEITANRIISNPHRLIQVETLNIDTIELREKLFHDLNLRREWIEQMNLSLLFWFHENQRSEIFTHAPDFWQFRSRSITFGLHENLLEPKPVYTDIKKEIKELQKKVEKYKDSDDTATLINYLDEYSKKLYDFGKYREAKKSIKQLLEYAESFDDNDLKARTLNNIGLVERSLGNYQPALNYYKQALELDRELGNRSGEASALNNIGLVERSLGNYQPALNYHKQALELHREIGDRSGEASALNNIGLVERSLGNYQSALNYYKRALEIFQELGEKHSEAEVMENISEVYSKLGKNDKAKNLLKQVNDIKKGLGLIDKKTDSG